MSRGFILLGINTEEDRIKYSYATALSIKKCDKDAEICLVVDQGKLDDVPVKYQHAFDYIVELRFGNTAHQDGFHAMNLWQVFHVTPFEQTIYVDSDTIFHNIDIDLLFDCFKHTGFGIPAIGKTYRGSLINPNWNSDLFEYESHYRLPCNFNNLIYFDNSSELAIEWFKMADPIFQNWRQVYASLFNEKRPPTFSKNILCNIVTHLLDVQNEVAVYYNQLYDLNLKDQQLWSQDIPSNWTEMLNYWITDDHKIQIENHQINSGIIHYRDDSFADEELLNVFSTK